MIEMKSIQSFIRNFILKETQDLYQGEHEAPSRHDGDASCPLWQMDKLFGEDIYSVNADKYFGDGLPYASQAVYIIKSYRNKPKSFLTIYRAVPDLNFEIKQKIKPLVDLLNYNLYYGFFLIQSKRTKEQNKIIDYLEDEKYKDVENYDQKKELILKDIIQQVETLSKQKSKPLKINDGDWVTTIKQYAIEHGRDNLNNKFKLISKKVRASDVYSEGNSIYEFGYSPEVSNSLNENLNVDSPAKQEIKLNDNFLKWFKKSKAVDENGKPLVLYHGTRNSFDVFKPSGTVGNQGEKDQIEGMYFTDNKDGASFFSISSHDKHLKAVFLSLQNPYLVKDINTLKNDLNVEKLGEINTKLKKLGYDGLIVERGFYAYGGPHKMFIAFYPNQIKSVYNNGSWNTSDNNIYSESNNNLIEQYLGSCVDVGNERSYNLINNIFSDATEMAYYVGNPDEQDPGQSQQISPKNFYDVIPKEQVPSKFLKGICTFHFIPKLNIFFIYNENQDVHYFFRK